MEKKTNKEFLGKPLIYVDSLEPKLKKAVIYAKDIYKLAEETGMVVRTEHGHMLSDDPRLTN